MNVSFLVSSDHKNKNLRPMKFKYFLLFFFTMVFLSCKNKEIINVAVKTAPLISYAWRLGLQSCARVVLIGLGQSSHGGRDARIFGAEVCLVCIVLYRFYAFVPIWTCRHFFFSSKMRSSNSPCFCCYRLMRWFGAFGRVVRQQRVAGVSGGWRPKACFFWFAA